MKIAVPINPNNVIEGHFGHSKVYGIFSISEDHKIEKFEQITPAQGSGCKTGVAETFLKMGVTKMLAGGIGEGAVRNMASYGIEVIRGCSGFAEDAVLLYVQGSITDSGESCSQHEEHGADHKHSCHN